MKQTIRLTESDLHKIVKESVNKILNEISLDTIGSADSQAQEKYNNYRRKYGENDPRTQKVKKQQQMFSGKVADEYVKGNLSKRARILSNQEKSMKGERTYVNGKGWRNDVNESILKEGGIHSDNIPSALLRDIEENFGNNSITQMDSSWYVVGVLGKYGSYEIDVPANGHCRIKLYRANKHGKSEDDQWYYYSTEWFKMCEENSENGIEEEL